MTNIIMHGSERFIPSIRVKEFGLDGVYKSMVLVSEDMLQACDKNIMDGKIFYFDKVTGFYYERTI